MPIFDTHAHYDSGGFNADRDAVLSALSASFAAIDNKERQGASFGT